MKNLKLLVSSALVFIVFAVPQKAIGMEDSKSLSHDISTSSSPYLASNTLSRINERERDESESNSFFSSDITEESQKKRRRLEEIRENLFEGFPKEMICLILEQAAINIDNVLGLDNTSPLKLVCKKWDSIVNKDFVHRAIQSTCELLGYGEIYQRFYNGKLIYRPNKKSDVGMVTLPISALANPLKGTFDLSQCGDTWKYLSISTGYRKGKRPENEDKVEIWFAPRFLIEKELNTTAKHLSAIFPSKWPVSAPVGMIWTWGATDSPDNFDYLTTKNMVDLSKIDLFAALREAVTPLRSATTPEIHHIPVRPAPGRTRAISCFICNLSL